MSFLSEILNQNIPIWDHCANLPFIRGLSQGTLPRPQFKTYMIQDSLYLKHYARILGKAIYLCETLKEIQFFYALLGFVAADESVIRLHYLSKFDLDDETIEAIPPLPENQNYINFLEETADQCDPLKILMAVLPCMLSYSYIFRKVEPEARASRSAYLDFIADYAEDQYARNCQSWADYADQYGSGRTSEEQAELAKIFFRASELELAFWKMAQTVENE